MFFKIESWNFQHLFEKEFRETSQNFNSFRSFRHLSDWVEILRFQKDTENFSFLSWKTKKGLFLKQIRAEPRVNWLQYQNKPALFTDPIFSDGFGILYWILLHFIFVIFQQIFRSELGLWYSSRILGGISLTKADGFAYTYCSFKARVNNFQKIPFLFGSCHFLNFVFFFVFCSL